MRALLPLLALMPAAALAQDAVRAGRFVVEHPTLHNLGFEWQITGDANRNATVSVRFRKAGESVWREALPLVRIGGERVFRKREHLEYTVPDGFAGSILNVEADTEYECRFRLGDPDGASGDTTRTVRVRTRAEPRPYAGGEVRHVYPPDHEGEKLEPHFTSLLQAYYGAGLGDWNVVWERPVQPGDTIVVHAGLYRNDRLNYVDPMMTPFDGTNWLTVKATAERPITIRAAGDGDPVFDGAGNHRLFDVTASAHHIFDGLTFRNTDIAIFAGFKHVGGAVGLTVRNCRFEDIGFGVWTEYAGSSDFYIVDNIFLGRMEQRNLLVGWTGRLWRSAGPYGSHEVRSLLRSEGLRTGPRHRSQRRRVLPRRHRHLDLRNPRERPTPARLLHRHPQQRHPYVGRRLHRDRRRSPQHPGLQQPRRQRGPRGYSAQPVFGGPAYFIRNLLYHVPSGVAFKFSAKAAGLFAYHNTIIGEQVAGDPTSNMHYRNNLILGRDTPARGVMTWSNATAARSSDYNGFRPNAGVAEQYRWLAPRDEGTLYEPSSADWQTFASLADFTAATGQEEHGIEVDFDIFLDMAPPDPTKRHAVYHSKDLNFGLRPGSRAVDAGVRIPTVNDDFAGDAPDLGALETGLPLPHYGPRWLDSGPFYQ